MKGIGNQLNKILTERKINKKTFAQELGLTPRQINNILKNESLTTIDIFSKICKILDIPSDFLLQDINNKFIIYTINDYVAKIGANKAEKILNSISVIFNKENSHE